MPRKRKAARAYQNANRSVREIVQRKIENSLALIMLDVELLFEDFNRAEQRGVLQELYPAEFFETLGFEASDYDRPDSVEVASNACVFRRPNFVQFLQENPPKSRFEPPDIRGAKFIDQFQILAKARGKWWVANNWPMTAAEETWIDQLNAGTLRNPWKDRVEREKIAATTGASISAIR
jgi:hypothetical protein